MNESLRLFDTISDNQITPTCEQISIIQAAQSKKNILVCALAGTGKTSTLIMLANTYPKLKGLYLAFNKSLQIDARSKFPLHIDCKTIHGLAYQEFGSLYAAQLTKKLYNNVIIESLDIRPLIKDKYYISALAIAESAKDMVRVFLHSVEKKIEPYHYSRNMTKKLLEKYSDLDFDLNNIICPQNIIEEAISASFYYAVKLWDMMKDVDNITIPANHDTYLKLYQLSFPLIKNYDYIMLDEAQDANPSILDILSNQPTQKIYVGDENQQIYGFRGTINAMKSIEGDKYYLTQSFRFGEEIANEANKILECNGAETRVKGCLSIQSQLKPVNKDLPYTFLSRTNSMLFNAIILQAQNNKKIHFVGDIDKIVSLFESAYFLKIGQISQIHDYTIKRFSSWENLVEEAFLSCDYELTTMINFITLNAEKTPELLKFVKKACQYSEQEANVIMSTAHKAKGKEWRQVILNNDFLMRINEEELNIYYVAVTRAINTLEAPKNVLQHSNKILTIELVPQTCWFSNVRSHVRIIDWEKLKKATFKAASYRCEICNGIGEKWPVECHEIWNYDDTIKNQKLMGLIALCPPCHQVKHFGFANINGMAEVAATHLAHVNGWSKKITQDYIYAQFDVWEERSQHQWSLDISFITQMGIKVIEVDRNDISDHHDENHVNIYNAPPTHHSNNVLNFQKKENNFDIQLINDSDHFIIDLPFVNNALTRNNLPLSTLHSSLKINDEILINMDNEELAIIDYEKLLEFDILNSSFIDNVPLKSPQSNSISIKTCIKYLMKMAFIVITESLKCLERIFFHIFTDRWYVSKRGNMYNPVIGATVYKNYDGWNIAINGEHYSGYETKSIAQKNAHIIRQNQQVKDAINKSLNKNGNENKTLVYVITIIIIMFYIFR